MPFRSRTPFTYSWLKNISAPSVTARKYSSVRPPTVPPDCVLTTPLDNFSYKDHVACVQVTGVDTGSKCGTDFLFADVKLKVHAYTLHELAAVTSTVTFNVSKDSQARVVNIPHESLAEVWERHAVPV
jgi:hypothetical protein